MTTFSWICPFCNQPVTIRNHDICEGTTRLDIENTEGFRVVVSRFIVCPNPECKKFALEVKLHDAYMSGAGRVFPVSELKKWQLVPQSKAQSFPDYIPKPILDDYNEACLILELSPKAAATLARRCLQGIIRDFWKVKVKSGKLFDEIEEIKGKVDSTTWEAIDSVRSVGNIGAHMEQDINLIIDVEPREAQLLVGLIEILLKDWYITRHQREMHLKAVKQVAENKKVIKKNKDSSTKGS